MTEVLFNGHAGRLEGRYHQSEKPGAPIALILHPHPQYGGTMNNKVVYSLFSCFQNLGFSVLRFNFRSVGRSQGEFEDGPGELSDATVAWTGCNPLILRPDNAGSPVILSVPGSVCSC